MRPTGKVLLYEAVGFGVLLFLLWADELLDLPHRLFGVAPTPTNHGEVLFESAVVFVLAVAVLIATRRLLLRLRHLEGLMHVCASCHKVRDRDGWVPMEEYLRAHSDAELRHAYCMTCTLSDFGYKRE